MNLLRSCKNKIKIDIQIRWGKFLIFLIFYLKLSIIAGLIVIKYNKMNNVFYLVQKNNY